MVTLSEGTRSSTIKQKVSAMPPLQNYVRGVHDLTDPPDGVRKLRAGFDDYRQRYLLGRKAGPVPPYWQAADGECPPFSEEFPFNLPAGARAKKFEHNSDEYLAIKEFVERTSRASSYKSSAQEDARMNQMRMVKNADWASEFQKSIAERRLKEGQKGSGVKPPKSDFVTVRDVISIQHLPLWIRYSAARGALKEMYSGTDIGRNNIYFNTETEPGLHGMRKLPVLDEEIGETLLFHVTSPDCIEKIAGTGFKGGMGRNYGTAENPRYGMLGQGSYFSNELSKSITYSTCFLCGDYQCSCRSLNGRRKLPRFTLLARVVIGNTKYYSSIVKKTFQRRSVEREFRARTVHDNRFLAQSDHGGGFDSVVAHGLGNRAYGLGTSYNPLWHAGSGKNEIMGAKDELIYPEFIVTFVIGEDDEAASLSDIVATVLSRYSSRSFGFLRNKSPASRKAESMLTECLRRRMTDEELSGVVLYYIGVSNRVSGLPMKDSRDVFGGQLNAGSTFFRYLVEEMQKNGYLAVA